MLVAENNTPTPTAFRYVAHVPPMAVGPQFAQAAPTLTENTRKLVTFSVGLAIGVPLAYFLIRGLVTR